MVKNNNELEHESFQKYLLQEILQSQRLRFLAIAGVYLFISVMFIIGGHVQKLPSALLAENWGVANYVWVILFNVVVGVFELVNYILLKRKTINPTYYTLVPYFTSFLEAIHPTAIIWVLSHNLSVPASLNAPPVFLYSVVIVLSALHINARLCIFTGAVAALSFFGLAVSLDAIVTAASIKAVYFFVIGLVAALVTNQIKNNFVKSRLLSIQKKEADTANVTKSKFLAMASHDLRQPLHAITLFTSVLDKGIENKENIKTLNNLKKSVTTLESLLNALLDISKLDAKTIQTEIQNFDISMLLKQLSAEFAPQATNKGLDWHCDENKVIVRSDPIILETILRNIISNAIRYTQQGEVVVECRVENESLSIDIGDTGVGISNDQQSLIFQEFQQLDNPERNRDKGLGLGLAIVDRLSRLLNHDIKVISAPDEGSHFIVTLPLGDSHEAEAEKSNINNDSKNNITDILILMIDDDPMIREGMNSLLSDWGYITILAGSGNEAIEKLKQDGQVPDIIITDLRLAGEMNGVQIIQYARDYFDKNIPALVISGDTAPDVLREVQDSGHIMMHKPVQPAKLHAFIKQAMRKRDN